MDDMALQMAISKDGDLEILRVLMEHGANIHAQDDYAIRFASEDGRTDMVKLLLKYKPDIHANSDYAIQMGNPDIIKLLNEYEKN